MSKLPVEGSPSVRGVLIYQKDHGGFFLYDLKARAELAVNLPPGSPGGWSADGRYLAFSIGTNTSARLTPVISIWDIETQSVVAEVIGDGPVWASSGHKFLYGAIDTEDPEWSTYELRLHDLDGGTERVIRDIEPEGYWSWGRDERYLILDHGRDEERKYSFSVYDLVEDRLVMTLGGAWPGNWLDDDTLGFTGDVCGNHAFYKIDVDGSDLEKVVEVGRFVVAHPSPQGDRIAYSRREGQTGITTVMDLTTRQTRDYLTGDGQLYAFSGLSGYQWSPDGKYLTVHKPAGKGGPCEFDPPQALEVVVH
jgi:Tol biopolymer transport system component